MRSPIGVADRVADRRHRRDDRHLAHAARAERMARVRHLDQDRLDHGQVGRHWAAVVEEARVIHLAVLVVDVLLVQRPADALHGAALDLPLHVARVDGAADILHRGVAHDGDLAGLTVHLHIADMRAEPGPAPCAFTDTSEVTGPPVRAAFSAMSASDSGSNAPALVPAGCAAPSRQSTASGVMSQIIAARCFSWSTTFSAAMVAAMPVAKVTRQPPVTWVKPIDAVSATIVRTFRPGSAASRPPSCRSRRASRRCPGCLTPPPRCRPRPHAPPPTIRRRC